MTDPQPAHPVRITAEDARPIRHRVLRPGQPPDRLVYPGDDAPTTLHLGVRAPTGELVSAASFYDEPMPGTGVQAIRLRGMATLPEHRSQGHGRRLIETACAVLTASNNGQRPTLWCNARVSAAGYYRRLGFVQIGDVFDIADIGAHTVMAIGFRNPAAAQAPRCCDQ
jgi:predicted GNAT family N-acyltransferase